MHDIHRSVGRTSLLRGIDVEVADGEFLAILGSNGAGKSTLLRILSGDIEPDAGHVEIRGKRLHDWHPMDLAAIRGVLAQQTPVSFAYRVIDLVRMGRYPHAGTDRQAFDEVAVDRAMRYTGVHGLRDRIFSTLSGGEQQRVHLARVLAQVWRTEQTSPPHYLFLDEPISSLDVPYQHQVLRVVSEFTCGGNVAVAVLHDLNLAARFADRILLLRDGQPVACGTPHEVLTAPLLRECYQYPVSTSVHPVHERPVVYFGDEAHTSQPTNHDDLLRFRA